MKFLLSKRAINDLSSIYAYSVEEFGELIADKYFAELEKCFELLRHNPLLGKDLNFVKLALRKTSCNKHAIYYTMKGEQIHVNRILHSKQDPMRHL